MKRRNLLKLMAGTAAFAGLGVWFRNPITQRLLTGYAHGNPPALAPQAGSEVCVLTKEQTEGPYYTKSQIRSDITEDRLGFPLFLRIEVINMPSCTPLKDAIVEVWHCDASGSYSGYGSALSRSAFDILYSAKMEADKNGNVPVENSNTYLRGGLITDTNGLVTFQTIFPGWYETRVCHIHVKVSVADKTFLVTQLYFPDELTSEIYSTHPEYVQYGESPYTLQNDIVLRDLEAGTGLIMPYERSESGIFASVRLGVENS